MTQAEEFLRVYGAELREKRKRGPYGYRQIRRDYDVGGHVARQVSRLLDKPTPERPSVRYEDNGNTMFATVVGTDFPTVDDIVERLGINLDEWFIDEIKGGAHELGRKDKQTDLTWTKAGMEGTVRDTGKIYRQELRRIEVKLRRRVLEAPRFPVVRPVMIDFHVPPAAPRPPRKRDRVALVLGDTQNGYRRDTRSGRLTEFHDRSVWDLFAQAVRDLQPDEVIFGGDMVDLPEWSTRWTQEPEFAHTTQPTLEELAWWFARVSHAAPGARRRWIAGNHDERLASAVIANTKAAYGVRPVDAIDGHDALSLPSLLALDSLGIEYVGPYPRGRVTLSPDLQVIHGDVAKGAPGATGGEYARTLQRSTVYFHDHRRSWVTVTKKTTREEVAAVNPGCACHLDGRVPGSDPGCNWQQGFLLVEYDPEGGPARFEPIAVHDGVAFIRGQYYQAVDRTGEIRADLPGWHW